MTQRRGQPPPGARAGNPVRGGGGAITWIPEPKVRAPRNPAHASVAIFSLGRCARGIPTRAPFPTGGEGGGGEGGTSQFQVGDVERKGNGNSRPTAASTAPARVIATILPLVTAGDERESARGRGK